MKTLKLSILTALVLSLSVVNTNQAQAGLIIGGIAGDATKGFTIGAIVGSIGTSLYAIADSEINNNECDLLFCVFIIGGLGTVAGIILDVDASLPTGHLINQFKFKLPFLDNSEVVENLAVMVKKRFKETALEAPNASGVFVQLTHEEINQALGAADLTEEQYEEVTKFFE